MTKSNPSVRRSSLLPLDKSNGTGFPARKLVVGVHAMPSFEHMSTKIAMPAFSSSSDWLLKLRSQKEIHTNVISQRIPAPIKLEHRPKLGSITSSNPSGDGDFVVPPVTMALVWGYVFLFMPAAEHLLSRA